MLKKFTKIIISLGLVFSVGAARAQTSAPSDKEYTYDLYMKNLQVHPNNMKSQTRQSSYPLKFKHFSEKNKKRVEVVTGNWFLDKRYHDSYYPGMVFASSEVTVSLSFFIPICCENSRKTPIQIDAVVEALPNKLWNYNRKEINLVFSDGEELPLIQMPVEDGFLNSLFMYKKRNGWHVPEMPEDYSFTDEINWSIRDKIFQGVKPVAIDLGSSYILLKDSEWDSAFRDFRNFIDPKNNPKMYEELEGSTKNLGVSLNRNNAANH